VISYIDEASIYVIVLGGKISVNLKFYSAVFIAEDITITVLILVLLVGAQVFEMLIS